MLAYLAGPLDGVTYEEGRDWYTTVEALAPPGWVTYRPGLAFGSPGSDAAAMDVANRAVIAHAMAVMVAYLDGPGRGFGTIREIEFARSLGRPVIVVSSGLHESLLAHDVRVVDALDEVWPFIEGQLELMAKAEREHPLFKLFQGEVDSDG